MASADFTVEGLSVPPGVAVAASATVDLALVSSLGVRLVEWSIVGNHSPAAVNPTITPVGIGLTASFAMPSGTGQAYLVQCKINGGVDENGTVVTNYIKRALVGVNNDNGQLPFPFGETDEDSATHGYISRLNALGGAVGTSAFLRTPLTKGAGNFTLALTDLNQGLVITAAAVITVPKVAVVAIPVGTIIPILRTTSGAVSVAPVDGDVTINKAASALTPRDQYSITELWHYSTNVWLYSGDITL